MIRLRPTQAQVDFARKLLQEAGYDAYDVRDIYGKDLDEMTAGELSELIEDMKTELGYD